MQYRLSLCGITLAACSFAQQAPAPAFEVASFKHVGDQQSNSIQVGPGSFRSNVRPFQYTPGTVSCRQPLISILTEAFQVKSFQIQGPDWLGQEVYELKANMPEATEKEAARLMIQKMLADRIGLQVRREQKEFPVFLLVAIPGTNKLEEVADAPKQYGFRMGMDSLEATPAMPLSALAGNLTRAAGRPVLDETGKKGYYKVKLQWNAEAPRAEGGVVHLGADSGIISALPQIGLKLEPAKRMMDHLIIEKVSKEPTEN